MIDQIIKEINKALDNDCFLVALMTALTLPDICGAIEYPKESEGSRYKNGMQNILENMKLMASMIICLILQPILSMI